MNSIFSRFREICDTEKLLFSLLFIVKMKGWNEWPRFSWNVKCFGMSQCFATIYQIIILVSSTIHHQQISKSNKFYSQSAREILVYRLKCFFSAFCSCAALKLHSSLVDISEIAFSHQWKLPELNSNVFTLWSSWKR